MAPGSASPPDCFTASPYPQPPLPPAPQQPTFRQRKSSSIISISPSTSDQSISPSTSPARSTAILPSPSDPIRDPSVIRDGPPTIPVAPPFEPEEEPRPTRHAVPHHVRFNPLERIYSNSSSAAEEGEATPLLSDGSVKQVWYKGPLVTAGIKFSLLFIAFTAIVVGTFWASLPEVDPEDKKLIKLPRSFADLQALNTLFQKFKTEYPLRILACSVVTYLFIQMFTLPGSMYLSILFGAAYGIMKGLLLACLCDAFGSALCYTLSATLAPPLLILPFYRARVETWRVKIMGDPKKGKHVSWGDVFAFLVVLRVAPFPPHWIPNFVAPHLGIDIRMFWLSCFIGIAPISVIHVTIGSSLDTMTSAADFHLLSARNIFGLIGVVVAVLIPVGLKRIFKKDLGDLAEAESAIEEVPSDATTIDVPSVGDGRPRRYQAVDSGVILAGPSQGDGSLNTTPVGKGKGKARTVEIIADIREEEEEDEDADEDEDEDEYDVFDERGEVSYGEYKNEKRLGPSRAYKYDPGIVRGYGSIETPVVVTSLGEMDGSGGGRWWGYAR